MQIEVEELTPQAFAHFGKVINEPTRPADAEGSGWKWWGENQILVGGTRNYAIGYLDLQPSQLVFDWAERHMGSDELLIPAGGGDCLVYVGPPDYPEEPGCLPALESFRVFRVRQGQGVLLAKGVWHGAPLAIDQPLKVVVLLLQGTGVEDGHVVKFPETPLVINL